MSCCFSSIMKVELCIVRGSIIREKSPMLMIYLPSNLEDIRSISSINAGINLPSKRGESKSIVVGSDVNVEMLCFLCVLSEQKPETFWRFRVSWEFDLQTSVLVIGIE